MTRRLTIPLHADEWAGETLRTLLAHEVQPPQVERAGPGRYAVEPIDHLSPLTPEKTQEFSPRLTNSPRDEGVPLPTLCGRSEVARPNDDDCPLTAGAGGSQGFCYPFLRGILDDSREAAQAFGGSRT